MTLDTIALCAFDYRFNSFYQREMHPFIGAMVDALAEAGARTRRPELASKLLLRKRRGYEDDLELMREVADALIAERKRDPDAAQKKDLLGLMLQGRDPVTGEGLSDENIRYPARHLPHRRARDDQRHAVVRDLLPDARTRRCC